VCAHETQEERFSLDAKVGTVKASVQDTSAEDNHDQCKVAARWTDPAPRATEQDRRAAGGIGPARMGSQCSRSVCSGINYWWTSPSEGWTSEFWSAGLGVAVRLAVQGRRGTTCLLLPVLTSTNLNRERR
jgi:hypothetical protein